MSEPDPWALALQNFASGWGSALDDFVSETFGIESRDAADEGHALPSASATVEVLQPTLPTQVTVSEDILATITECPVQAYTAWPLTNAMKSVETLCRQRELPEEDPDLRQVMNFFFQPGHRLHGSKEALGQVLGMPPKIVEDKLTSLTAALLYYDAVCWTRLIDTLVASGGQLVSFLHFGRYDETPVRITQSQFLDQILQQAHTPSDNAQPGARPPTPSQGLWSTGASSTLKDTTVSKMLASEEKFALLMRMPLEGHEGLQDELLAIFGSVLSWNQLLERGSGSNLLRALQQCSALPESSKAFGFKGRVVTTDQASSNFACEKLLGNLREQHWPLLHIPCTAHIAARIHHRVFSFLPKDLTGVINVGLVLNQGPVLARFRATLVRLVMEGALQISRHPPSQEADSYKTYVLDAFCAGGPRATERRLLLTSTFTGDWRTPVDPLQVYIPAGVEYSELQVRRNMAHALVSSLAGRSFHLFPRHRWVGCELALDQVGLLLCVHDLGRLALCECLTGLPAEPSGTPPPAPLAGTERPPPGQCNSESVTRWSRAGVRGC